MNVDLQNIKNAIAESTVISDNEKEILLKSIKAVDKELTIVEFKLQRTEKVKRTTSVLLEETIDELENKRADVEKANLALKKSLDELKAAQAQLIQSEKMASLGELTAGIAHEIQNPLNFVNNFSEISVELVDEMNEELGNGDLGEAKEIASDIKQNLEKINNHGQRASSIIKGMLQHSRTSTGQKELTDINALADEYLRLAYHGMQAKDQSFNVDFELEIDKNLPNVNVIPQDIGRVFLNLINNAFYAVDKKAKENIAEYKPSVKVSTKLTNSSLTDEPGQRVAISVEDNGSGIPPEIKDKIFQPFFTTKPTGQGTGLGLSLSYDIVSKLHEGELKVESIEGETSKFTILLPV